MQRPTELQAWSVVIVVLLALIVLVVLSFNYVLSAFTAPTVPITQWVAYYPTQVDTKDNYKIVSDMDVLPVTKVLHLSHSSQGWYGYIDGQKNLVYPAQNHNAALQLCIDSYQNKINNYERRMN